MAQPKRPLEVENRPGSWFWRTAPGRPGCTEVWPCMARNLGRLGKARSLLRPRQTIVPILAKNANVSKYGKPSLAVWRFVVGGSRRLIERLPGECSRCRLDIPVSQRRSPNAGCARKEIAALEGRALSRPLAQGTRPRRSVALHVSPQHVHTARTCYDATYRAERNSPARPKF